MKRFILSVFLFFILLSGIAYSADKKSPDSDSTNKIHSSPPNPYVNDFPFKSAVINYKSEVKYGHGGKDSKTYTGTEVTYIEGQNVAYVIEYTAPAPVEKDKPEDEAKPEEKTREVKRLQIVTGDYIYYIDLTDDEGIKVDNAKKYAKVKYTELTNEEKEAFYERMERRGIVSLDLLGLGKKVGTDKILGRECDVYEYGEKPTDEAFMTAVQAGITPPYLKKTWVWREARLPLKVITDQMGSYSVLEATEIKENVDIPDSRFEVPEGIRIVYNEKMSESSKNETLSRFKLYKTGQPMMLRVKPEPGQVLTPEGNWVPSDSPEGKKVLNDTKNPQTETSSNSK